VNLKLLVALFCAGIAVLVGSAAFVATLPASQTGAGTTSHAASVSRSAPGKSGSLPNGWTVGHRSAHEASGSSTTSTTNSTQPSTTALTSSTTQPAAPPSTAFVLVTISYAVKKGDTLASIESWFDRHGYGTQFAANLQVIEDNQNLLVPGAVVSLSNGVMTIHSPI
jgi:hypothetical protein